MAKHNDTGFKGEQLAEQFLLKKGYVTIEKNWRNRHKEVDLIAIDGDMLVFIEIKTRSSHHFGFPEESVTNAKQKHLKAAADAYLEVNSQHTTVRFDVISIILQQEIAREIVHLIDAF